MGAGFGAYAGHKAQQGLTENLPKSVQIAMGQTAPQVQADVTQHPYASLMGEDLPGLAFGRPSARMGQLLTGGALGAGVETAREGLLDQGRFDPARIAIQGAAGASQSAPWRQSLLLGRPDTPIEAQVRTTRPNPTEGRTQVGALRTAGVTPTPADILPTSDAEILAAKARKASPKAADLIQKYADTTRTALPGEAAPLVENAIPVAPDRTPDQLKATLEKKYADLDTQAAARAAQALRRSDTKATTIGARSESALADVNQNLTTAYEPPLPREVAGEQIQNGAAQWAEDMRLKGGDAISGAEIAATGIPIAPTQTLKRIDQQITEANQNPDANKTLIKMLAGWKSDLTGVKDLKSLRNLKSSIYRNATPEGLNAGDVARLRADFRHNLTDDIRDGLTQAGADNPKATEALNLFDEGNRIWSQRQAAVEGPLKPVLGKSAKADLSDPENITYTAQQAPETATEAVRNFAKNDYRSFDTLMGVLDPEVQQVARDAVVTDMGRNAKGEVDPERFILEAKALPAKTRELLFRGEPIEAAAQRAVEQKAAITSAADQRQTAAINSGASRAADAAKTAETEKAALAPQADALKTGAAFSTLSPTDFADAIAAARTDPMALMSAKVAARQFLRDALKTPDSARKLLDSVIGENSYAQTNLAALLGTKEASNFITSAGALAKRQKAASDIANAGAPPGDTKTVTAIKDVGRTALRLKGGWALTPLVNFLHGKGMSAAQAEQFARDATDPSKTDDVQIFIEKLYGQNAGQAWLGRVRAVAAKAAPMAFTIGRTVAGGLAGNDTRPPEPTAPPPDTTVGAPATPAPRSSGLTATIDPTAYHPKPIDQLIPAVAHQESRNNPAAVSSKGAEGVMQVMPATQVQPGHGVTPVADNSPEEKQRVGEDYLRAMIDKYHGNQVLGLMGYNWGEGNVDRWIKGGMKGHIPRETKDYLDAILGS